MIKINNTEKGIMVTSTDANFPYRNGKLSVPFNSLIAIVDESDVITFRSVANNDIIFYSSIDELLINDVRANKETFINEFDKIANKQAQGDGSGQSVDLTNYYTIQQVDEKIKPISDGLNNKVDLLTYNTDKATFALKDELPTKVSQLTNDSGYITSIPSEYVTETELNEKNYVTNEQLAKVWNTAASADFYNNAKVGDYIYFAHISYKGIILDIANRFDKKYFLTAYRLDGSNLSINKIEVMNNTYEVNIENITLATKGDIPSTSNFATKSELNEKVNLSTYTTDKATFALKDEIVKEWVGTQQQYDELTQKDSNTIYNIIEG